MTEIIHGILISILAFWCARLSFNQARMTQVHSEVLDTLDMADSTVRTLNEVCITQDRVLRLIDQRLKAVERRG
jgi:hypothetical protein